MSGARASQAGAEPASPEAVGERLVGTWRLQSRVDRDRDGRVVPDPTIGVDPLGYLVYDRSGHMHAQIMARDRVRGAAAVLQSGDGDAASYLGGYYAYFGRYEIDAGSGRILHHLDGSLAAQDVGRTIARAFTLANDTLTLSFEHGAAPAARLTRTLVWRKICR